MTGSIPKTLLSIGLLLVTAIGSAQVSIRAQYIFEGQPRSETAGPIKVEISNNGPDLNGALTFEKSENQINYPIDLPRGSTKAITLYDGNLYGGDPIHLSDHPRRRRRATLRRSGRRCQIVRPFRWDTTLYGWSRLPGSRRRAMDQPASDHPSNGFKQRLFARSRSVHQPNRNSHARNHHRPVRELDPGLLPVIRARPGLLLVGQPTR